jgi:hypothetical protein
VCDEHGEHAAGEALVVWVAVGSKSGAANQSGFNTQNINITTVMLFVPASEGGVDTSACIAHHRQFFTMLTVCMKIADAAAVAAARQQPR